MLFFVFLGPGPTVAVICEYDALPGVGHACGHNLIAESGIAAGIAIKAAMETTDVPGKVITFKNLLYFAFFVLDQDFFFF